MQLEARMARLERRCRILTAGLMASVCVIGVSLLTGAAQNADESTMRTRRIEIADSQGNVRIEMGRVEDDTYGILVYGHERQAHCKLIAGSVDGAGAALITASAGGRNSRQGITLTAQDDSLGVAIRDSKALRAATLVHEGKAQFQLRDRKQNLIFIAPKGDQPIGRK